MFQSFPDFSNKDYERREILHNQISQLLVIMERRLGWASFLHIEESEFNGLLIYLSIYVTEAANHNVNRSFKVLSFQICFGYETLSQ